MAKNSPQSKNYTNVATDLATYMRYDVRWAAFYVCAAKHFFIIEIIGILLNLIQPLWLNLFSTNNCKIKGFICFCSLHCTGWGTTETGLTSQVLMKVEVVPFQSSDLLFPLSFQVPIMDQNECLTNAMENSLNFTEGAICAGGGTCNVSICELMIPRC